MPPAPMMLMTSYGPRRVPAVRVISVSAISLRGGANYSLPLRLIAFLASVFHGFQRQGFKWILSHYNLIVEIVPANLDFAAWPAERLYGDMAKAIRRRRLSKREYQTRVQALRESLLRMQVGMKSVPFKVLLLLAGSEG